MDRGNHGGWDAGECACCVLVGLGRGLILQYAADMDEIHALGAAVSSATGGAKGVEGGNWRIFEGMVYESGATQRFRTEVGAWTCNWFRSDRS